MLFALNENLQRISSKVESKYYFCPVCGREVQRLNFETGTDKTSAGLDLFGLKRDKYNWYFKHPEPNHCEFERETNEHQKMKKALSKALPLENSIDFVHNGEIIDVYVPQWKLAIDCQTGPETKVRIRNRIIRLNSSGLISAWFFGGKNFNRGKTQGKYNKYRSIRANTVERMFLEEFSNLFDDERHFNIKIETAETEIKQKRIYCYYDSIEKHFIWINIFHRSNNRYYCGIPRDFLFNNLALIKTQTKIGDLGIFRYGGDL